MSESPSFVIMRCGCRVPLNHKPTKKGERRKISFSPALKVAAQLGRSNILDPSIRGPEILMEEEGRDHWIEEKAIGFTEEEREGMKGAHEFVFFRKTTFLQRQKAEVVFGPGLRGKVPRCWIEKSGTE